MLSKVRNLVGYELARQIYITTILPHFDYMDIVYDCLPQNKAYKLEKVHNKGMRILTRADPRTHIVDLHQMTQLTSLQDRRTDHVNLIMFKVTLGEVPDSIKEMFKYISEVRERITRSVTRGDLFVPPKRIDTSARCLS